MPEPQNILGAVTRSQSSSEHSQELQPQDFNQDRMAAKIPLQMPEYFGNSSPTRFVQMFNNFCTLTGVPDQNKVIAFSMALQGPARDWFFSLPNETTATWEALQTAFKSNYELSKAEKVDRLGLLFLSKQKPGELAVDFILRMKSLASAEMTEETVVQ